MKAVILAAGVGSRIKPLTDNIPKPLIKIGDKTILQRMVDNLLKNGINKIAIVTGYKQEQIKDFTQKTYPNLEVIFIKNELYEQTNTAYSLNLTKDFVSEDDFIKFDADVVFEDEILQKLINDPALTALCIDKNIHLDKEEVKVISDNGGRVKKVGKKLNPNLATGESIGIEKIGKEAGIVLFNELEKVLENKENLQEYYDDVYTTLVKKGIAFHAVNITNLKWVEVDTLEDLEFAKKLFDITD